MELYFETSRDAAFGSPTVAVDLVVGEQLAYPVWWAFLDVSAGPTPCVFDYVTDTVGSDAPFYQSLRFGAQDLKLQTFRLSVPDRALPPALAEKWLEAPRVRALPRLCVKQNFAIDRVDGRVFHAAGRHLMGLFENDDAGTDRVCVQIAEDFSLLFRDGRYVGWVLEHPIAHVVSPEQGDPLPSGRQDDDASVAPLFHAYFELIDDPMMERMENGDPVVKDALRSLIERVGDDPAHHGPRFALRRQLVSMATSFYGNL